MSYEKEVLEMGLKAKKGTINEVIVEHDENCNIFKSGTCNCLPKISIKEL